MPGHWPNTGPEPRCSTGTAELGASIRQGRQRLRALGWAYSEPLGLWLWAGRGWGRSGWVEPPELALLLWGALGVTWERAYSKLWAWAL